MAPSPARSTTDITTEMTEQFEIFDEDGTPLGLAPRAEVHRHGLWHRSAHVFLFTPAGALWIQRRAAGKDLYPDRWDFTVGEHLTPGETYLAGALRGLVEELGIEDAPLEPVGPVRRHTCRVAGTDLLDREFQQAFRGTWDGTVTADPAEVAEVRCIEPSALTTWMQRAPDDFTPWFVSELQTLNLLPAT